MGFLDKLFGKKPAPPIAAVPKPKESWNDDSGVPQEFAAGEVRALLASSDPPQLVDVREQFERENDGYLANDIHLPMDQLEVRAAELDKSRPVVVYCASGMRSMECGAFLLQQGFREVINLNGGLNGWPFDKVRTPAP